MRKYQRGQALIETAIALPLVLMSLYFLFWTAKYAILSERLESDTRYTAEVLDSKNLFTNYSIAGLYDSGIAPEKFTLTCATPVPDLISDQIANVNSVQVATAAVWNAPVVSSTCVTGHQPLLKTDNFTRDILIGFDSATISANLQAPLGGSLSMNSFSSGSFANGVPISSQSISFFRSATVGDLALCYPALTRAITGSLINGSQGLADGTAQIASTESLLNESPLNQAPSLSTSCTAVPVPVGTGSSGPASTNSPPAATPEPSVSGQAPTPGEIPTPPDAPTIAPLPTPAPTATAVPSSASTPSKPKNTPQPARTAKPKPSPVPTVAPTKPGGKSTPNPGSTSGNSATPAASSTPKITPTDTVHCPGTCTGGSPGGSGGDASDSPNPSSSGTIAPTEPTAAPTIPPPPEPSASPTTDNENTPPPTQTPAPPTQAPTEPPTAAPTPTVAPLPTQTPQPTAAPTQVPTPIPSVYSTSTPAPQPSSPYAGQNFG